MARERMTLEQRLAGRGIFAVEVDGVLARLTKSQSATAESRLAAFPLVEMGAKLAAQMRKRVTENGDLADQRFPGYSSRGKVKVSVQYAYLARANVTPTQGKTDYNSILEIYDKAGKKIAQKPIRQFANSAAFHSAANTKPGSYDVTGGMWSGLQARGSGADKVIIDFIGSSPGTGKSEQLRSYSQRGYRHSAEVVKRSWVRDASAQNRFKAWVIYNRHKINVLKPSENELDTLSVKALAHYGAQIESRLN